MAQKVSVNELLGISVVPMTVPLPGGVELDFAAVDPKSPAVLVTFFEKSEDEAVLDPKERENKALQYLVDECQVEPPELRQNITQMPSAVKMGVKAKLTEMLGEDAFFAQRSRLVEQAVAKALAPVISREESRSSSTSPSSSAPTHRPSVIAPVGTPSP